MKHLGHKQESPEFRTTRWSLVFSAGGDGGEARGSLGELCLAYWYPLYAFSRRKGLSTEAAEDSVQGFFSRILEREDLKRVDPARGSFRSWLRVSFRNYLVNQAEASRASKRGGGAASVSLESVRDDIDWEAADLRFATDRSVELTPEQSFERAWAVEVLQRARRSVFEHYENRGKGEVFEALKPFLIAGHEVESHATIAERLNESVGSVRVAVHRLRKQFREALEAEVLETVQGEVEVEAELGILFESLGHSAPPSSEQDS